MADAVRARLNVAANQLVLANASPIAEPRLRLNVVCPYYTMFPIDFPLRELADASPGEWVLDPFCGRGTTAYAARLLGLPTVGVDADAVAVAVARAKLLRRTAAEIEARLDVLLEGVPESDEIPTGDFWALAFDAATLDEICRLRRALLTVDTDDDVLLRAIVLGVLHGPQSVREPTYLSNQMPRTYATKPDGAVAFWRKRGLLPRRVGLREAVSRRARYLLKNVPDPVPGVIVRGDSRHLPTDVLTQRFSRVVTSPPYLGMRTYRPDQWLRHWFLGGPASVDYAVTDMLPSAPAMTFARELGSVWSSVATVCRPGATMSVRFGVLPSYGGDPEQILRESFALTGGRWSVELTASAGTASLGKRQAGQMRRGGEATNELDVKARLVA